MTRVEEMQEKVRAAAQAFDQAMQGREVECLETEPVCGVWSARDVAAHLVDWNSELLASARHAVGGRTPQGHPILDDEPYNQAHAQAHLNEPWEVSKAALDASVAYTLDFLGTLSDDDLDQAATTPWNDPTTIEGLIVDVAGHIDEHVQGLEH